MHRKHIRRWHKLLGASASLVAILAGLFVAPASAQAGPSVDMFWADVSMTTQPTVYFYLSTTTTIKNLEASDFLITGSATGCAINETYSPASFFAIAVTGCSDGTVGLQLGANSVSDLSGNWGPEFGAPSDLTTIDRIAPEFNFAGAPTESPDASFVLTAYGFEVVRLFDLTKTPAISGEGCYIAGIGMQNKNLTFAITGCKPGAQAMVTIFKESYADAIGNLGPSNNVVSPIISVAALSTQQSLPTEPLPKPTSSPTATATPTASPTATATPTASPTPTPTATPMPTPEPTQAAVAPVVEVSEPPAPPALPEPEPLELGPEQPEPIAAPSAEPFWQPVTAQAERTYVSPGAPAAAAPEPPAESPVEQAPAPQIITALEPSEPAMNLSWVTPAASVIATVLAAVGAGVFMRRRVVRTPRARFA